MDKSYDASKSDGSIEDEWMDLSKSDYAKVIFSNLYWNVGSGDVGCFFTLTVTVKKNPSDYIGIYKVGYDHLSQCLALKKLNEFESNDESKPIHCHFKSDELPDLNGFYQFLYVTQDNEVCGASMPFEVRPSQKRESSPEEVVTERIENDFLMVRYGLEQKNDKLETLLKTYEAENVVLVSKMKDLTAENAALAQKLEETQKSLNTTLDEFQELKGKHEKTQKSLKGFKELKARHEETLNALSTTLDQFQELKAKHEETQKFLNTGLVGFKDLKAKYETSVKDLESEKAKSEEAKNARLAAEKRCRVAEFKLKKMSEDFEDRKQDFEENFRMIHEAQQLEHREAIRELRGILKENSDKLMIKDAKIKDLSEKLGNAGHEFEFLVSQHSQALNEIKELTKILKEKRHAFENKDLLIEDLNKILKDREEELKSLKVEHDRVLIDIGEFCKLLKENCNVLEAKELSIRELKKKLKLCSEQEAVLKSELSSTKKLLENKREDKEEMFCVIEKELQNSHNKRDALEREVKQLKRYLQNPQEYTRRANREPVLQTTEDERLVVEQLEDSKFMIKALEDSKQLAMKEMHELSEKLRKAKEELGQLRCENMALKIFLEDKKLDCGNKREDKEERFCVMEKELQNSHNKRDALEREVKQLKRYLQRSEDASKMERKMLIVKQTENINSEKILFVLRKVYPSVDVNNLPTKLEEAISNYQHQTEEFKKAKIELNLLRCENMALKIFLEEKTKCDTAKEDVQKNVSEEEKTKKDSNKEVLEDNVNLVMALLSPLKETDPSVNVENMEEKIKELVKNMKLQTEEISKLKEESKSKDDEVESLKKNVDILKKAMVDAIREVEDKTARIVQAAELYKDLYKEKEKLAKQLKKVMLTKSRSKKSSFSKSQESATSSFLGLNIEKGPSSSETTSNNSDSDTGEHFRAQILYPDLRKDENYIPEAPVMNGSPRGPINNCNSIDGAINNLCTGVKEDQVYQAPQGMESNSFQQLLSVDENTHIPCCLCGKSFLVTRHSNVPMMEHFEKEHFMVMCPICGQMFDKSFPSKYLMFHVNDHFKQK